MILDEQIESIEESALLSLHQCVSEGQKSALGLEWHSVDGFSLSICRQDDSILLNRCLCGGRNISLTGSVLSNINNYYDNANQKEFFLQLSPAVLDEQMPELLTHHSLRKTRGWMKFLRRTQRLPSNNGSFDIVKVLDEKSALTFANIVAPAFDLSAVAIPLLASLYRDKRWSLFLVYYHGQAVSTGAVFIEQGLAYTDWGATVSSFRGRGCQSLLLHHRIDYAYRQSCSHIVTCTGEAWEGDPQHSYNNILRAGFKEHYLRENWAPRR